MAQNRLPENRAQLTGLGTKMLAGLTTLRFVLGITQITEIGFKTLLDTFTRALSIYNQARSSQQSAYDLYHARMSELDAWLKVARGILVGDFGNRWNTLWAQTGFPQPSTAIPRRMQDRIALVLKLAEFFTANPSYEVAVKGVTAAQATLVRKNVIAAQDALQASKTALETASAALQAAQLALTTHMRMLIAILRGLLAQNDPRWEGFGLHRPGMKTTPAAPTGLRATLQGSSLLLENDPTPLADRYLYRRKILGIDSDYELVASSPTPMALLEGIAAGLTQEIIVQAAAANSQSVASAPITIATPLPLPPPLAPPTATPGTSRLPSLIQQTLHPEGRHIEEMGIPFSGKERDRQTSRPG